MANELEERGAGKFYAKHLRNEFCRTALRGQGSIYTFIHIAYVYVGMCVVSTSRRSSMSLYEASVLLAFYCLTN